MDQGFTVSLEDNSVIVSAVIELGTTLLCLEWDDLSIEGRLEMWSLHILPASCESAVLGVRMTRRPAGR